MRFSCDVSLQSRNACQQWLPVTLHALPSTLAPMVKQFQEERQNRCSLFGLVSVLTVAKSHGHNVSWVSNCVTLTIVCGQFSWCEQVTSVFVVLYI